MALPTYADISSPEILEETRQHRVHIHKQTVDAVTKLEAKWVEGENELIVAFLIDSEGTTKFNTLIIA